MCLYIIKDARLENKKRTTLVVRKFLSNVCVLAHRNFARQNQKK